MTGIEYYKVNHGNESLVITKNPMAWFSFDAEKTGAIEKSPGTSTRGER